LQQTADKLCDGSIQPLLTHLVRGSRLSARDRQSLRTLLDELDKEGRKSGKK
jgi:predicted transcriptional regulator